MDCIEPVGETGVALAPATEQPRQALLIIGMHRSGTSALTGVLHQLGVAMPSGLMPPAPDNPTGFWESVELSRIHDSALAAAGTRWDTPAPIPSDWFVSDEAADFRTQIQAVLERDFADCSLFAIKDPRICLLFPLWEQVLQQLKCTIRTILPIRHPEGTIASLMARNQMSPQRAQLLWLSYVLLSERVTRNLPRAFVRYDDLLADWRSTLASIEANLGWQLPARTADIEANIDNFLQANLRHHQPSDGHWNLALPTHRWVRATYEHLRQAAVGVSTTPTPDATLGEPTDFTVLDAIYEDFLQTQHLFSEIAAEAEATVLKLQLDQQSRDRETDRLQQELEAVRNQHAELQHRFNHSERRNQELQNQSRELQQQTTGLQEHLKGVEFQKTELSVRYQLLLDGFLKIKRSRSWRLTTPLRWGMTKGKSAIDRLQADRKVRDRLAKSVLFDEDYYRQTYARDLESTRLEPLDHFLQVGTNRNYNPHRLFDTGYYRARNEDVVASGTNPLWHFLEFGGCEGRKPHPLFDSAYYLRENPAVLLSQTNPLEHYLDEGARQRRNPSEFFDTEFYLAQTADAAASTNPLVHFIDVGAGQGLITKQGNAQSLEWKIWPALEQAMLRGSLAEEAAALSFPDCEEPDISIVIPVYNKLDYTLQCLKALMPQTAGVSCEVILADDCSTDETQALLKTVPGLQYCRNPENLGFLRSCNRAAGMARGGILVLLNNDTVPLDNWLTEIVVPLQQNSQVGLVGSMLLYPNGCLQEAGGAIWEDGSGWNIGRLRDPEGCDYQFVREVDYCSGASFAVPIALWRQLDGFDLRYAPAYYEDTDFAFRVREAGLKVVYTPFSQLVHFEGISSGTDTSSGVKRYQAVNQSTFAERWQTQLQDRHSPKTPELATYGNGVRPHLLWLDALTPTPDRDSGSIDALNFLTVAREMGWDVSFIPTSNLLNNGRYTKDLQRLGVRCLYWPHINSVEAYLETYGHLFDVVMLSRVSVAESLLPIVRRLAPQASIGFNTVDLHFLRQQRQQEVTGDLESVDVEATRAAELASIERSDLTIAISDVEAATIRDLVPSAIVKAVPIARTIPGLTTPFAERRDICFLGGFNHEPNVDAVLYFVSEIWPLVADRLPDCNFLIAGADMPDRIRQLESDRIQALGYVEELSDLFERVRLSVAPLRFGAGLKGKVISSFSYGVPAVCTPIAVEGMALNSRYANQLVAEQPEAFAICLTRAYSDAEIWTTHSDRALTCVQQQFSMDAVLPAMKAVLNELKQFQLVKYRR